MRPLVLGSVWNYITDSLRGIIRFTGYPRITNSCISMETQDKHGLTLKKIDPTTGTSKKRLQNKPAKYKIYDVTRNPEEWITDLKLLRGDQQKLDAQIYN